MFTNFRRVLNHQQHLAGHQHQRGAWDDDRLEKMPAATASASSLVENLGKTLPPHFQQAQATLANHRKNIVSLHRLHASCATLTQDTPKGTKLVGEKAFNDVFLACLNRVLGIKRGVANADRAIKFVAGYCTCELPFFLFRVQKNRPEKPLTICHRCPRAVQAGTPSSEQRGWRRGRRGRGRRGHDGDALCNDPSQASSPRVRSQEQECEAALLPDCCAPHQWARIDGR